MRGRTSPKPGLRCVRLNKFVEHVLELSWELGLYRFPRQKQPQMGQLSSQKTVTSTEGAACMPTHTQGGLAQCMRRMVCTGLEWPGRSASSTSKYESLAFLTFCIFAMLPPTCIPSGNEALWNSSKKRLLLTFSKHVWHEASNATCSIMKRMLSRPSGGAIESNDCWAAIFA